MRRAWARQLLGLVRGVVLVIGCVICTGNLVYIVLGVTCIL